MTARFYYLGPWQTSIDETLVSIDNPLGSYWHAPAGTLGLIDLRSLAMGETFGFFTTAEPLNDSAYIALGDQAGTRLDQLNVDASVRAKWRNTLGLAEPVAGDTLLDLLWNTITLHADPNGDALCPPLMPTHRGDLQLWLGGHSLAKTRKFQGMADPAFANVASVIQRNYARIADHPGGGKGPLKSKYLWSMAAKLGLKGNQWEALIPAGLPKLPPQKPTTTLNESWPTDGTTISSGQDLTWDIASGSYEVVSNTLRRTAGGTWTGAVAQHDLSSDDHAARCRRKGTGTSSSDELWACARFSHASGSMTLYCLRAQGTRVDLFKGVGNSYTSLGIATPTQALDDLVECEADGSAISGLLNSGVVVGPVTDTSIIGTLRCGIGPKNDYYAGAWEAEDLVAGPIEVDVSESASAADAPSATLNTSSSVDESATAADDVDVNATLPVSLAESATAEDVTDAAVVIAASVEESATATDSTDATVTHNAAIEEAAAAADAPAATLNTTAAIEEDATASDTVDAGRTLPVTLEEAAAVEDAQSATLTRSGTVDEQAAAQDQAAVTVDYALAVEESAAAQDATDGDTGLAGSVSESVAAADTVDATVVASASVAETAAAQDAPSAAVDLAVAVEESVAAADVVGRTLVTDAAVDESATVADTPDAVKGIDASVEESVSASDETGAASVVAGSIAESVVAADDVSSQAAFAAEVDESAAVTDIVQGFATFNIAVSEQAAVLDAILAGNAMGVSVAELVAIADTLEAFDLLDHVIIGRIVVRPMIEGHLRVMPMIEGTVRIGNEP